MTAKIAVAVMLGSACFFAPAAFVAQREQVRLHAFTTEGAAAKVARTMLATAESTEPRIVALAPVEIFSKRTPRAPPPAALPSCRNWRPIAAGAKARSAGGGWVRACDGPPDDVGQPLAARVLPGPATTSAVAAAPPLQFVVDLAAPK